jgi:hypothetical protein
MYFRSRTPRLSVHVGLTFLILPDTPRTGPSRLRAKRAVFDLLAEDDRLTVYAGELEVRPPLGQAGGRRPSGAGC